MKKLLAILLAMVLALGMLAGCGSDNTDGDNTATVTDGDTSDGTTDGTTDVTTDVTTDGTTDVTDGDTSPVVSDFKDVDVFTVNDDVINLSSVNIMLIQIRNMYESQYGADVWSMEASPGVTVDDYAKNLIEDTMVRTEILNKVAAEKDITLDEDEQAQALATANTVFSSYTPEMIAEYGITLEAAEALVVKQTLAEKTFTNLAQDFNIEQSEIDAKLATNDTYVNINKFGVEAYYEQVRARHILVSTIDPATGEKLQGDAYDAALAKITDLRQRALDGEDFASLATENTDDPGSKDTGGEYTFGRGQMVPEFEDAAYALKVGEISDIVETSYGFHIIKLEERIPATDDDIAQGNDLLKSIEDEALYRVQVEKFEPIYEDMKADYTVVVNDEVWGSLTLATSQEATPAE